MSTTPSQPNNRRKLWYAIAIVAACAIIGIIIWKMIEVNPHTV